MRRGAAPLVDCARVLAAALRAGFPLRLASAHWPRPGALEHRLRLPAGLGAARVRLRSIPQGD
eukprot:12375637-Alexandrium_andersonii.AAC.1